MNALKFVLLFGLVYGVYVMQGVYQAEAAHAAFARDLDQEIARVDINRDEREGRQLIRKHVRKVAGEHQIPLDERRMKITYERNPEFGEGGTSSALYVGNKVAYEETPYKGMSRATVSLSYKRSITPYYVRQFSYTGASGHTGSTLTDTP